MDGFIRLMFVMFIWGHTVANSPVILSAIYGKKNGMPVRPDRRYVLATASKGDVEEWFSAWKGGDLRKNTKNPTHTHNPVILRMFLLFG